DDLVEVAAGFLVVLLDDADRARRDDAPRESARGDFVLIILDEGGLELLPDLLRPAVVVAALLRAPDVLFVRELEERFLCALLRALELELADARDVPRRRVADLARELQENAVVQASLSLTAVHDLQSQAASRVALPSYVHRSTKPVRSPHAPSSA